MPLDVASAGPTAQGARAALDEAVKLFIQTAREHGTLEELLEESGYEQDGPRWRSPDWVCFEKHSAPLAV